MGPHDGAIAATHHHEELRVSNLLIHLEEVSGNTVEQLLRGGGVRAVRGEPVRHQPHGGQFEPWRRGQMHRRWVHSQPPRVQSLPRRQGRWCRGEGGRKSRRDDRRKGGHEGGCRGGRRGRRSDWGVEGAGAASLAVFERRRLAGDPGAAAGRREDEASLVTWSSDDVRPKDAAVARAIGYKIRVRNKKEEEEGPLFALLALVVVHALVTVAGVGAARGGNSSHEISTTEVGEGTHAVGVTSRESMGAGVASLSHPSALAVWLGAGELRSS
ncbi:hypothetical protein B0H13DRAFT_1924936 [Mycena leptocephala]|nr:hypothetical protein B0H13DRAFT_1924936 [Mycena leptocephala]